MKLNLDRKHKWLLVIANVIVVLNVLFLVFAKEYLKQSAPYLLLEVYLIISMIALGFGLLVNGFILYLKLLPNDKKPCS